jgi:hypothetical protein
MNKDDGIVGVTNLIVPDEIGPGFHCDLSHIVHLSNIGEPIPPMVVADNLPHEGILTLGLNMKMSGPADFTLASLGDQEFEITYWRASGAEFVDSVTGEVTQAVRCQLMDPQGRTLSVVSVGVLDFLMRLVATLGVAKFDPPIRVRQRTVKTRLGRNMVTLDLVRD